MSRTGMVAAAGFTGGVLLLCGFGWIGALVLGFTLVKARLVWRWWLTAAVLAGLLTGYQEAKLQAAPPLPAGPLTVQPTAITQLNGAISVQGVAQNGVPAQGLLTVTDQQRQQLLNLSEPVVVTWHGQPTRLVGARNQYQFDYAKAAWASRRLAYTIPKQALVMTTRPPQGLVERLVSLRLALLRRIDQLPKRTQVYSLALLLGIVAPDFNEQRDVFTTLGLVHLFAVSGLHLFALVAGLYWVTDRLRLAKEWVDWALIVSLPLLLAVLPAGVGLVRAVWLRVGLLLRSRLRLPISRMDVLSLVLIGNELVRPLILTTMGGQLTYLLTAALMLLPPAHSLTRSLQLHGLSVPVVLAHTGVLQVAGGLFAWLLLPLLVGVVMPLLLLVVLWPKPQLTWVSEAALTQLDWLLQRLAALPVQLTFGRLGAGLALIGVVVALKVAITHRVRIFGGWLAVAWLVVNLHLETRVVMFDVGQGDAILVELPLKQGTLLIDTGGQGFGQKTVSTAEQVILPYLVGRGISHIDTLLISHADADHVGDAAALSARIPIRQLVTTPSATASSMVQAIIAARKSTALAGSRLTVGQSELAVVAPVSEGEETNANSLVLSGRIAGNAWLFTGDTTQAVEKTVIAPQVTAVDYLKVAHHGSTTSSDAAFISQIRPKVALVSTGVANRFHHPAEATVQLFKDLGVPLLNTAQVGMIQVISSNGQTRVITFLN